MTKIFLNRSVNWNPMESTIKLLRIPQREAKIYNQRCNQHVYHVDVEKFSKHDCCIALENLTFGKSRQI